MSYKLGKNLICDACGTIVFLADITGFSHESRYEDIPVGWTKSADFGDMCPICSRGLRY